MTIVTKIFLAAVPGLALAAFTVQAFAASPKFFGARGSGGIGGLTTTNNGPNNPGIITLSPPAPTQPVAAPPAMRPHH